MPGGFQDGWPSLSSRRSVSIFLVVTPINPCFALPLLTALGPRGFRLHPIDLIVRPL